MSEGMRNPKFNELVWALRSCCPEAFCEPPVPLAVGLRRQVVELVGEQYEWVVVERALRWWTSRPDYLAAVIRGDHRRNLDGSDAGEPTEAAKEYSCKALQNVRHWRVNPDPAPPPAAALSPAPEPQTATVKAIVRTKSVRSPNGGMTWIAETKLNGKHLRAAALSKNAAINALGRQIGAR